MYERVRGGSRTAATSKVQLFVIIVNGRKSLTIIKKSSTLDVSAVLDPPLRVVAFHASYLGHNIKFIFSSDTEKFYLKS